MSRLSQVLPTDFAFYHLGRVERSPDGHDICAVHELSPLTADHQGIAFTMQGDERGVILLLLEAGLDASVYSEMGNILASRMADTLSQQGGLEVMISPPRHLDPIALHTLVRSMHPDQAVIRCNYAHFYRNSLVMVQVVILSLPSEVPGYV